MRHIKSLINSTPKLFIADVTDKIMFKENRCIKDEYKVTKFL